MFRPLLTVCITLVMTSTPGAVAAIEPNSAPAPRPLLVDDDGQECGFDTYSTIAAALAEAEDGDTIRVCPGLYRESIRVSESVGIVGPLEGASGDACAAATTADLEAADLTQVAVIEPVEPTADLDEPLVTLAADDVELAGLVVRNAKDETSSLVDGYTVFTPAVSTDDDYSGYRIHDNLIHGNTTLGLEFGSSGIKMSRVDHNCLRENTWGLANQRQTLTNARIDTNTSHRTTFFAYEIGWGLAATELVTLQDNTSIMDGIRPGGAAFRVENATSTRIVDNTVTSPTTRGFGILGGNTDVEIRDNVVTGSPGIISTSLAGITLFTPAAQVAARSTGIVIDSNTITDLRSASGLGVGIAVGSGAATGVKIQDNVLVGNAQVGLWILNGNTHNLIRDNLSSGNSLFGIRVQGTASVGNMFTDNRMFDNGLTDARDDTDDPAVEGRQLLSTWIDNKCRTDNPEGAICGVE